MSRRKEGGLEAAVALVARLPWWLCLGLAILSYFALHVVATRSLDESPAGTPLGVHAASGMLIGVAAAGQIVLPIGGG